MKLSPCKSFPSACLGILLGATTALPLTPAQSSQSTQPAQPATPPEPPITLEPPTGWELQSHLFDSSGKPLHDGPVNFRRLGEARVGETADLHSLTLRFGQTVKLTGIQSTRDFRIESGGSCVEGNVYQAKSACTLLVRFTPQGPGRRLGRIDISHSGFSSPTPLVVSGFSYAPVISFLPSVITTIPATNPGGTGLLSGAQNMAFDGGDTLYIADTLNYRILMLDSSGTIKQLNFQNTDAPPLGIAADSLGNVFYSEPSQNIIHRINFVGGLDDPVSGQSGTPDNCRISASCYLANEIVKAPGSLSIDSYDTMLFPDNIYGAALSQLYPLPSTLVRLEDFGNYPTAGNPGPFAADASGKLYTNETFEVCEIGTESLGDAENFTGTSLTKFAGGRTCGFSGDGGQARNAEISAAIGQFAFDMAGGFYFADAGNQRVRRVEPSGIIRTIAGNGTQGYTGDGGSAIQAELQNPSGVAVNSLGAVYIVSGTDSGQVVRKVGPGGYLNFGNQTVNTVGAAQQFKVTNTGNVSMLLANTQITGPNAADFTIDPASTNCVPTPGYILGVGQTCSIGILFKPSAGGARTATLTLVDNTISGFDTATLRGNGLGTGQVAFAITSPADGSSYKSTANIPFTATVSSSIGALTTGTVTFKVDNTLWATIPVSSGKASTTVYGLSVTGHSLSATYNGDSNYAPAGPLIVGVTVTQVRKSSVSLSQTVNAGGACSLPQFVATVSSQTGQPPTGEVQLLDGGVAIASGTLQNGHVTLAPHPLSPGPHTLTAGYSGNADYLPSVSSDLVEIVSEGRPCKGAKDGAAKNASSTSR